MGQYFLTVNLDKGEYIDPHNLGLGLKALEQVGDFPASTGDLLLMLLATNAGRGGGDFALPTGPTSYQDPNFSEKLHAAIDTHKEVYGRWAGDRIAFVGDYTEDEDMPHVVNASGIYGACRVWELYREAGLPDVDSFLGKRYAEELTRCAGDVERTKQVNGWLKADHDALTGLHFVEISEILLPYMEANFGVGIAANQHGWRERVKVTRS
jgi:hypothetical protein